MNYVRTEVAVYYYQMLSGEILDCLLVASVNSLLTGVAIDSQQTWHTHM